MVDSHCNRRTGGNAKWSGSERTLRVLCLTHAWPSNPTDVAGIFVQRQVASLRQLGVSVEVLVAGGASGDHWLTTVKRLRERLATSAYDLVHAQYGGRTALAAVTASRGPVVLSFCGTDLNGLTTGSHRERAYAAAGVGCSQLAAPLATALITKSAELSTRLWRSRDRDRCHVIPNGVDLDAFRPIDRQEARARLNWPADRPVVLVSGQSDSSVKRLDLAEAAVEHARCHFPTLALVKLSGVSPPEVPLYLNAADVVLLTSQHEGSPNIVKEALACNVAVVSVDVGDVRRWLEETPGGWLCERSPADLAEAITKAVRCGGHSQGREVIAALSLSQVAARIREVYEKALRLHARRRSRGHQETA